MNAQISFSSERIDLVDLAAELLKERDRSFPREYVQNNVADSVWKILLVLYQFNSRGQGVELLRFNYETTLNQGIILRFVKLLIEDDFICMKKNGTNGDQGFVFLTQKGTILMDGIFQRLKRKIAT